MQIHNLRKEVFTIPNLLSFFRLILIPVYITIYMQAKNAYDYWLAAGILAVSCLTDMIDGKIARHCNMISTLGKILDPVADKATQFAMTLCLSMKHPILIPVLALFVVKELFQLVAGAVNLRKGKMLPGALLPGKICTAVLFVSLIGLVLFPAVSEQAVTAIAAIDTVFLCIAFVSYILAYFGKHQKLQALPDSSDDSHNPA